MAVVRTMIISQPAAKVTPTNYKTLLPWPPLWKMMEAGAPDAKHTHKGTGFFHDMLHKHDYDRLGWHRHPEIADIWTESNTKPESSRRGRTPREKQAANPSRLSGGMP